MGMKDLADGEVPVLRERFVDTRDGIDNLWAKPVAGEQPRQLTKFTDSYLGPFAVAPDGRSFAVSRIESTNEIVLVKNFR